MLKVSSIAIFLLWTASCGKTAIAGVGQPQPAAASGCPRPQPGATVEEPADLRSRNGVLEVALTVTDAPDVNGSTR
jgi:hypothetical protein